MYNGIFSNFKKRNSKTGESVFTIKDSTNTYMLCKGIVPYYTKGTPLALEGKIEIENDKSIFKITKSRVTAYNKEVSQSFLCNKLEGVGEKNVEKIFSIMGIDFFEYTRNNNMPDNELARKAYQLAYKYTYFEKLYDYVLTCKGNYSIAHKIFEKYSYNGLEKIKRDPYKLLSAGIEYCVIEKIAKDNGIEQCNEDRISGIVRTTIEHSRNNGNTRIDFLELVKSVHELENYSDCGYYTHPIFIAEEVQKKYIIEEYTDGIWVYKNSDYYNEEKIAKNIVRFNSAKIEYEYEIPIYSDKYSKEQLNALNMLKTNGLKILTGGPGTGKTTTTNKIIEEYIALHPHHTIKLLAPTGCAARRLAEATGRETSTVHSGLGLTGYDDIATKPQQLEEDFIIIDEYTFVDAELTATLFSSIKSDATILLLGDTDQLPSVNAGDVLRDFIDSDIIECYKLTKVFRQTEDNSILTNSRKIIAGDKNLIEDKHFKIYKCETEEDIVKKVISLANMCYSHKIDNFKLYTPTRKVKFATGTINMNKTLKSVYRNVLKGAPITEIEYGYNCFSIGDKVIFTHNVNGKFYNGQEGIVKYIEVIKEKEFITIESEDKEITISGEELDYLELAYAITAHKSQGSECDNAIIIIPKQPFSLLKRQLLYVEVTRAKNNVIIVTEKDALDICISTYGECKRNTGLCEKLWHYCI